MKNDYKYLSYVMDDFLSGGGGKVRVFHPRKTKKKKSPPRRGTYVKFKYEV